MKPSISPCFVVGNPINLVRWNVRPEESGPWKSGVIYWRKDFPTDRLKKLCEWSRSKEWYKFKQRHFARQCEAINDFRFAVIEEIKRLKAKLSEKQKREFDGVRRRMNPPRRKLAQSSHELTPAARSIDLSTDVRMKCEKIFESKDTWDSDTRDEVIESIERIERFLAEEKRKLQK